MQIDEIISMVEMLTLKQRELSRSDAARCRSFRLNLGGENPFVELQFDRRHYTSAENGKKGGRPPSANPTKAALYQRRRRERQIQT